MALDVYSSRDVIVNWGGIGLDGFAPDSFITVSRNEDFTDEEVGADGKLQISVHPNRTATVTLVFQQNSSSNRVFSYVQETQNKTNKLIITSLSLTDPSSGTTFALGKAHLKSSPDFTYGSSATGQTREWTLFVENMTWLPIASDETAELLEARAKIDSLL